MHSRPASLYSDPLTSIAIFVVLATSPFALAQKKDAGPTYESPETAVVDPDFSVQGEYLSKTRGIQVVALGQGKFLVKYFGGGLPGDKAVTQSTNHDKEYSSEEVFKLLASDAYNRVVRTSPTLNAKPPEGAVVLFDGSDESLESHWKPGAKKTPEGNLAQGCTSIDTFQDFTMHLEFRTPFKPNARGQQRGNSGVYYQGRYETQVLDSFGLEGLINETGGIYSISAPILNMCLPPLTWQTYDADFTAARFSESGKKSVPGRLSVKLNGVLVQDNVKLTKSTTASPLKEGPEPGPIYIQDHRNPVQFRNIWVLPK